MALKISRSSVDRPRQNSSGKAEASQSMVGDFRNIADVLPDAMLLLDGADNIAWFNEAARNKLGLRVPEDVGQAVTNLLREPDFANWIAIEDQVQSHLDMTSPMDSNIHLRVHAMHHGPNQRLLILRDVTDVHNLERIRRDFVANVSHELRTPLTVLLGYLEGLQGDCNDELRQTLNRMQDQASQMHALLDDLLELSRLQADRPAADDETVDVPGLLSQLQEQAEELSQGRHSIRFDIGSGLGLRGAAMDLESAFRNLITNAIYYTPDGGRITVRWKATEDGVEFSVEDTGIGIPRRDIPRLTERFYRVGTDRSRHSGGTGLGLAIVKHVLNAHQARLVIESDLGEGSRFRCIFIQDREISLSPAGKCRPD